MERKNWRRRWSMLITKIERLETSGDRRGLIKKLSHPEGPSILAFVNAHAMNLLASSQSFYKSLGVADTVVRDGSGMEILFDQLIIPPGINLNGTDLIPDLIQQFNGRCIALFGTQNPYLEDGANFVKQHLAPQSKCITADGFLDDNAYISLACERRPALIVLGMGMPRQEEVAVALRAKVDYPCLIICGGAIIDFMGGKTNRAPIWMRRAGLEWLYRLNMEPRRLFQRYVIGNVIFLVRVIILTTVNQRLGEQVIKRQVKPSASARK